MKHYLIVFLCVMMAGAVNAAAQEPNQWAVVKKSNGITSYERKVPGTGLKEFRAVTVMDAGMDVIGETLRDIPSYPKWLADCESSRIEKRFDRNNMIIHLVLTPPILKVRDVVLLTRTFLYWDYGKVHTFLVPTDEVDVAPVKGCTRLSTMKSSCEMTFLGRNKTKFVFSILVDPKVKFPITIGMTYPILKNYPYRSLEKLRLLVQERKYAELARGTEEQRGIDRRVRSEPAMRCAFTYRLQEYAADKKVFREVMDAHPDMAKAIVSKGGSYDCSKQCAIEVFADYIDRTVPDKRLVQRLVNDRKFKDDLVDMMETSCGEDNRTVDSLVEEYRTR